MMRLQIRFMKIFNKLHPELLIILNHYIVENEIKDIHVQGISLEDLMINRGMSIYSSLIHLNVFILDSNMANDFKSTDFKIK